MKKLIMLLLLTVSLNVLAESENVPTIYSVIPTYNANSISLRVTGINFARKNKNSQLYLSIGKDLSNVNTTVSNFTDTGFDVTFPNLANGDYLLRVSTDVKFEKEHSTAFEITLGATGPKGNKGDKGDAGPQGVKGDTGPAGAQGPQGLKGDTGPAGAQGPKGDKGDAGATGPAGPQGMKGDTGTAGVQGPQGLKGDAGPAGPQGLQGVQGEPGPVGPAGPQGPQGAFGIGLTGPQGQPGPQGPAGVPGLSGFHIVVGPMITIPQLAPRAQILSCNPGEVAISGGWSNGGGGFNDISSNNAAYAGGNRENWQFSIFNTNTILQSTFIGHVICVTVAP